VLFRSPPQLRPEEDPDAARAGGLFHLVTAAALSNPLAQLQLAWCALLVALAPAGLLRCCVVAASLWCATWLTVPRSTLFLCCVPPSGHLGLEPSSTQLAHLLKEGRAAGDFQQHPALALRYTQLAAERGYKGAAAALAHAYATGGLGGGGTGREDVPVTRTCGVALVSHSCTSSLDASCDS
jgi:hypothetical protein